jgi:hypothetical protein
MSEGRARAIWWGGFLVALVGAWLSDQGFGPHGFVVATLGTATAIAPRLRGLL